MLYITTRDNKDAYTAHRALHEDTAIDGGAYVPFRMPALSAEEITGLCSKNFSHTVAAVLNFFFACRLSGWDVEFCIGRKPLMLTTMTHRIVIAELWHNPEGIYSHICSSLYRKLCGDGTKCPSEWFKIAAHISVLFGIYSEMRRDNIISASDSFDISASADDLAVPLAAMYARQMGLPVKTIVFSTEGNSGLWDFIHLGEIGMQAVDTDSVSYERLVHATLGCSGVSTFRNAIGARRTFRMDEDMLSQFNNGLFCSVTGKERGIQNINSIYRSNSYIPDPMTAFSVGGLQDYRAKTGESRLTLVLSCASPIKYLSLIADATGISQENLSMVLKNQMDRR